MKDYTINNIGSWAFFKIQHISFFSKMFQNVQCSETVITILASSSNSLFKFQISDKFPRDLKFFRSLCPHKHETAD